MRRLYSLIFVLLAASTYATHIVGGEMIYDYLGKQGNDNIYRITLKIYRDCLNGVADFDGINSGGNVTPALITVREVSGLVVGVYDVGAPVVVPVPGTINSPCIQTPKDACLEEGTYTYTLILPPRTGGYYVIYQRCCRNNTIANITQPGDMGSSYFTRLPGPEEAEDNNSPRFKNFPPIFLCANVNFSFDHMATDPDSDQLTYEFYDPFLGIDKCCVAIGNGGVPPPSSNCPNPPSFCPTEAPPPPYGVVSFIAPFTATNPVDASRPFQLDPVTGMLTGKPRTIGQYVVGICVKEFRNGALLNTHYRDFQFNIRPCVVAVESDFAEPVKKCRGSVITFTNESTVSTGIPTFAWDFGVRSEIADTSTQRDPVFSYQDTGQYHVTLIVNRGKPCADTMTRIVYVYPALDVSFAPQPRQCLVNNSFSFVPVGEFIKDTKYRWEFGVGATPSVSTNSTGVTHFTTAGVQTPTLYTWHYACRDSFADTVFVIKRPQAIINNLPVRRCVPGTFYMSNGSQSDLPYTCHWRFSNGDTSSLQHPSITFTPSGVYRAELKIRTTQICVDSSSTASVLFTVDPLPVPGFTVSPKYTTIFDPDILFDAGLPEGFDYGHFDFGDSTFSSDLTVLHTYARTGTFVVTQFITNYFGCKARTTDTVFVYPEFRWWEPNVFTPDGNDRNDRFVPVSVGALNYTFEIFNKWGERLFISKLPNEGWDGTYKGERCKQDIYTWRADFRNAATDGHELRTGRVLLLRSD